MARSVSFEDVGYCWGHNLNDTLVWGDDLFADGAATGTPAASINRRANSCDGQRTPTVEVPAERQSGK